MDMPKIDQEPEMTREERITNLQNRIGALKERGITEIPGSDEIAQNLMNGLADLEDTYVTDDDLEQLDQAISALENQSGYDREEREEEETDEEK